MPAMLITYQPAGRSVAARLSTVINGLGNTWSPIPSVWLLNSYHTPAEVLNYLRTSLMAGDDLLVVETSHRYATNLPEGKKTWLYQNMR